MTRLSAIRTREAPEWNEANCQVKRLPYQKGKFMQNCPSPCTFCRGGRCVTHGVRRFVAWPGRKTPAVPDEAMIAVGCCDRMQDEAHREETREWRWCPYCGWMRS
jgi:hypothetical protein